MSVPLKRNFAAIWDEVAKIVPDAMALVEGDKQTDWQTYENRAARLASALVNLGIEKDSKVAIYGYNSSSWIEAHYAIFKARAVPVNVNYRYTSTELEYLLENSDAEVIFFDAQFSDHIDEIRDNLPKLKATIAMDDGTEEVSASAQLMEAVISENEPLEPLDYSEKDLFMLYTGGTTGMPKGVVYLVSDIAGLLVDASFAPYGVKLETWDDLAGGVKKVHAAGEVPVTIPACPLMHGTGLSMGVLGPHIMGGCVAVYRNHHLDTEALLRLVEEREATELSIVGDAFAKPMIATLRQAAAEGRSFDLSSLQKIRSSGAMFSLESKQALLEFADVQVMDTIAASEGSMGMSVVSRQSSTSNTGSFRMGPKTRVFDENYHEVEPGSDVIGLVASSHVVPVEYYKDPEKSAATFKEINGVRYTIPGDYAKVAADGSLILMGRGSNCINTGGEKVYPEEVEETLKLHPQIVDSLVVGVPDDRFGQRVVGIVEADGDVIDSELIEFSRKRLAGYKIPRSIIVADKVKRAPNGKADYKWAKSLAYEQLGIEAG